MNAFGKIIPTISAWLTALMTLVAGVPQVRCGCPGGDGKASTSVPVSCAARCCCCCATSEASADSTSSPNQTDECPCCQQRREKTAAPESEPTPDLQKPRCVKELKRTTPIASPRAENPDHEEQVIA